MTSYEHQEIARTIDQLEMSQGKAEQLSSWLKAEPHLNLLKLNSQSNEVILLACTRTTFIHAVIAKEQEVIPPDYDDLLKWNSSPNKKRASYSWQLGNKEVNIVLKEPNPEPSTMQSTQNLVFAIQLERLAEPHEYEILQEFAHATGILWREDESAYCRIDENGDFEPVLSITNPGDPKSVTLITCKREPLEQFLAASESALVRFFNFTMVRRDLFRSWNGGVEGRKIESENLFYDQCIHPDGHSWTRGTQILPVLTNREMLFRSITETPSHRTGRQYATFIIEDWRNNRIVEVSTEPNATSNYFTAADNSLPYEMSWACFRPEVLSKYKADRDKYTLDEESRAISCRGAWYLKSYDINPAGQVFAYLCDLRNLPYQEQLHWKSFNEEPKATISERAYENDFQGTWSFHITPLERVLNMLRNWATQNLDWWRIKDESLLLRFNTPIANSKDEWAQSFLELSKAVIENFRKKPIQAYLRQQNIDFDKDHGTLILLEKLLQSQDSGNDDPLRLEGMKQAWLIRSKVQSHNTGTEADQIARNARREHGTFKQHFESVCTQIADELENLEATLPTIQERCESDQ